MRRRDFVGSAVAAVIAGGSSMAVPARAAESRFRSSAFEVLPNTLAGKTLTQLRDDYRDRLFRRYLPFWHRGGLDEQFGGITCELNDDGLVAGDEKFIWYQGRAIWLYAYLYNNFGKDERFLKIAGRIRDFMVKRMHAGGGRWNEKVRRDGTVVEGPGTNVYGGLFAAAGLAEYYKSVRNAADLELAEQSIWAAVKEYDDPGYGDTHTTKYTAVPISETGIRSQGHSMVIVWILSSLLTFHEDAGLEKLQREHLDIIMNRFWNPDYGISNEYLRHDYTRLPEAASHMFAGHSLETIWIAMHEALRIKDRALFETAKNRIRRLLEMCWDYVFDGWGDGDFFVHQTPEHGRGPQYEVKTMWAHCEILIACMTILEYSGEVWAQEWYERTLAYTLRTMANTPHGVWRQAVDRHGNDLTRVGVSAKRKGNFHQPRFLMMNIQSLDRMIANGGRRTPFPK